MAGRERLRLRAALSRLPRWVTVLGIGLVLGVLAGGAAPLAVGTPSGLDVVLGRTQTVVLKVDGVPPPNDPRTDCKGSFGCDANGRPTPAAASVSYSTPAGTTTNEHVALPFTKKVQVPVTGGVVTVDAFSFDDIPICSILLNGKVLKQPWAPGAWASSDSNRTTCGATIPSVVRAPQKRPTSAPRPGIRRLTLRVGGLSLGDTLDYQAPAVSAYITRTPYKTFTKDLWVRSGSFVMIHASTRHDPVTCSIAADGRLLLQRPAAPWHGGLSAFCQAKIP